MKDKNGVLIYEGDICRIVDYGTDWESSTRNCVIKYIDDFATFCPFSGEHLEYYNNGSNHFKYCLDGEYTGGFRYFLSQYDSYEIEIIGNIQQDGDLLNE